MCSGARTVDRINGASPSADLVGILELDTGLPESADGTGTGVLNLLRPAMLRASSGSAPHRTPAVLTELMNRTSVLASVGARKTSTGST